MRPKTLLLVAVAALGLQGCAAVLLAAGAGGGAVGAQYMQPTDRTFTAPLEQVRSATSQALKQLAMPIQNDYATDDGRRVVASAADKRIDINLENVTYNTTRMSVSVTGRDGFVKDHTTEQQILAETGQVLGGPGNNLGAAAPR